MKHKKQVLIGTAFLIIFSVYFYFFFQSGIIVDESFLTRKQTENITQYNGGKILISVEKAENTAVITFKKESTVKSYKIISGNNEEYFQDITIYENDTEIFNGLYDGGGNSNFRVFEKDGSPYFGDTVVYDNESNLSKDSLNVNQLVNIYCDDFNIRGNVAAMAFAVILLIIWAIDICFPKALFWFSHFISVENPEPTEFYLTIQRISWVVVPIIAAIFMLYSLI